MKLSEKSLAAIMVCLQKSLAEQCDIVELFNQLDFIVEDDMVSVATLPSFAMKIENMDEEEYSKFVA